MQVIKLIRDILDSTNRNDYSKVARYLAITILIILVPILLLSIIYPQIFTLFPLIICFSPIWFPVWYIILDLLGKFKMEKSKHP
jgi:hypothetical protein